MVSGSITVTAYLVMGRTMDTMSTSCGPFPDPATPHHVGPLDLAGNDDQRDRFNPGARHAGNGIGCRPFRW